MDRKEFLQKLSLYAFGTITLTALLSFILPNHFDSKIVKPNYLRLKSDVSIGKSFKIKVISVGTFGLEIK